MPNDTPFYDAIVIGGGLAGLTAMRDLRELGRSVLLLEARDRLGGRTWYREFAGSMQKVEIGGTWTVDSTQHHVAREKARYGIGTVQSPAPKNWRMNLDGKIRDNWLPVDPSEIADFEQAVYHLIHDARRITVGVPLDQQELDDLDVSLETWMNGHGVSGGTRAYISAFVALNFGGSPSEVGVLHFLAIVAGMGYSPWTYSTVLTNKFAGGTKALVDALAADGLEWIRLSTPVASVTQSPNGVSIITRSGETLHAATVVVATPLNTWNDLHFSPPLQGPRAAAASAGHVGHAVKPWALVSRAPDYFAGWAWDGGMCYLATEFQLDAGSLMVGFAHSADILDITDPADVAEKVSAFLPPEAEVLSVDGHDWIGDEFSKGTWVAFAPGQLTKFHSALIAPEERIVFAGSDIALTWSGWIEGALESGQTAASQVNEILLSR